MRLHRTRGRPDPPSNPGGFSEGHSGINEDLMHWGGSIREIVDADAQAMLRAVYGTIHYPPQNHCPCVDALKAGLLAQALKLDGPDTMQVMQATT